MISRCGHGNANSSDSSARWPKSQRHHRKSEENVEGFHASETLLSPRARTKKSWLPGLRNSHSGNRTPDEYHALEMVSGTHPESVEGLMQALRARPFREETKSSLSNVSAAELSDYDQEPSSGRPLARRSELGSSRLSRPSELCRSASSSSLESGQTSNLREAQEGCRGLEDEPKLRRESGNLLEVLHLLKNVQTQLRQLQLPELQLLQGSEPLTSPASGRRKSDSAIRAPRKKEVTVQLEAQKKVEVTLQIEQPPHQNSDSDREEPHSDREESHSSSRRGQGPAPPPGRALRRHWPRLRRDERTGKDNFCMPSRCHLRHFPLFRTIMPLLTAAMLGFGANSCLLGDRVNLVGGLMFVDEQDDMSNAGLKYEMERLHRMTAAQISEAEARLDSSHLKSEMERLHYMTMTKMYETERRLENSIRNVACRGREMIWPTAEQERRREQDTSRETFESRPIVHSASDRKMDAWSTSSHEPSRDPTSNADPFPEGNPHEGTAEDYPSLRGYVQSPDGVLHKAIAEDYQNLRGYVHPAGHEAVTASVETQFADGQEEAVRLRRLQSFGDEDRRVLHSRGQVTEAPTAIESSSAPKSKPEVTTQGVALDPVTHYVKVQKAETKNEETNAFVAADKVELQKASEAQEEVDALGPAEPGDEPLDVAGGFGHGYAQGPGAPRPEVRSQLNLRRWRVGLQELKVQRRADPSSPVTQSLRLGDIIEQVAPAFNFPNGLVRIQIRHPSSPTYPLPIGWVTQERGSHKMLEPAD